MPERITPDSARRLIEQAGDQRWVTIFKHGLLECELGGRLGTDEPIGLI